MFFDGIIEKKKKTYMKATYNCMVIEFVSLPEHVCPTWNQELACLPLHC